MFVRVVDDRTIPTQNVRRQHTVFGIGSSSLQLHLIADTPQRIRIRELDADLRRVARRQIPGRVIDLPVDLHGVAAVIAIDRRPP